MEKPLEESSSPVEVEIIACERCQNALGYSYWINDHQYLRVGGLIARETHGVCVRCGKEFHWSVPDRNLGNLIKKRK